MAKGSSAILAVKIVGDAKGAATAFDETEKGAGRLGTAIGKAGPLIGAALVAGAAAGTKALYDVGATWDDVRDTIRVGTGATGEALEGMFESAKSVAASVPAAIEDIGPVVADINTRMGLTGDTLETVATQYLEAGRILGETVDIQKTSAAFNAFGIEGAAVEGAMDSLFQVSQATGVGMNDLAGIVQKASPALTNLGFGFEESAALAGSLDKAGLDAAGTMNAMSRGLVSLAKSGEEPADAFQRVIGEMDGFIQTGDTAAALDIASKVFGTRGAAQFVAAVESGTIGVEDLMGATGATTDTIIGLGQETADAAEKWQILKNKALVALEPIGSAIFDGLGQALDWVLGIVDTFDWSPFSNAITGAVDTASGALNGIKPIIDAVVGWFTQTLMPVITGLAESFQERFTAVQGIVGEFAAGLWTHIEPLIPLFQDAFTTIGEIVTTAVELVTDLWDSGTAAILTAWEVIGPPLINVVGTIFKAIGNVIGPAVDTIKAVIKTALSIIRGDWSGAWDGIKGIVDGVWRTIKSVIGGAIDVVKSVISNALGIIRDLWSRGWTAVKDTLSNAWSGIKTAVSTGVDNTLSYFRDLPGRIVSALSNLGGQLNTVGRNIIQGLINGVKAMASRVVDSVRGVIRGAIDGAKRLLGIASPSKLFKKFGEWTGEGFATGLTGQTKAVARAGTALVDAAVPTRIPTIPAPEIRPNRYAGGPVAGTDQGRTPIHITIQGALDPERVARQIRDILTTDARIRGAVDLNQAAIA